MERVAHWQGLDGARRVLRPRPARLAAVHRALQGAVRAVAAAGDATARSNSVGGAKATPAIEPATRLPGSPLPCEGPANRRPALAELDISHHRSAHEPTGPRVEVEAGSRIGHLGHLDLACDGGGSAGYWAASGVQQMEGGDERGCLDPKGMGRATAMPRTPLAGLPSTQEAGTPQSGNQPDSLPPAGDVTAKSADIFIVDGASSRRTLAREARLNAFRGRFSQSELRRLSNGGLHCTRRATPSLSHHGCRLSHAKVEKQLSRTQRLGSLQPPQDVPCCSAALLAVNAWQFKK